MLTYKKPQQRKEEECERIRGERDEIKLIRLIQFNPLCPKSNAATPWSGNNHQEARTKIWILSSIFCQSVADYPRFQP